MYWFDNRLRSPLFGLGSFEPLFRDFERWFQEMDDWTRPVARAHAPQVVTHRSDEGYELLIDLPGAKESDVNLSVHRGVLTVSATRKTTTPEGYKALRKERSDLSFSHSVQLPDEVEEEAIKAEMKDGVLRIRLPRRPEVQPKQIAINAQ